MVEKGVFFTSDIVRYLYPNYILVELSSFFRLILPLCGFFGFVFFGGREASLLGTRASTLFYVRAISMIIHSFRNVCD